MATPFQPILNQPSNPTQVLPGVQRAQSIPFSAISSGIDLAGRVSKQRKQDKSDQAIADFAIGEIETDQQVASLRAERSASEGDIQGIISDNIISQEEEKAFSEAQQQLNRLDNSLLNPSRRRALSDSVLKTAIASNPSITTQLLGLNRNFRADRSAQAKLATTNNPNAEFVSSMDSQFGRGNWGQDQASVTLKNRGALTAVGIQLQSGQINDDNVTNALAANAERFIREPLVTFNTILQRQGTATEGQIQEYLVTLNTAKAQSIAQLTQASRNAAQLGQSLDVKAATEQLNRQYAIWENIATRPGVEFAEAMDSMLKTQAAIIRANVPDLFLAQEVFRSQGTGGGGTSQSLLDMPSDMLERFFPEQAGLVAGINERRAQILKIAFNQGGKAPLGFEKVFKTAQGMGVAMGFGNTAAPPVVKDLPQLAGTTGADGTTVTPDSPDESKTGVEKYIGVANQTSLDKDGFILAREVTDDLGQMLLPNMAAQITATKKGSDSFNNYYTGVVANTQAAIRQVGGSIRVRPDGNFDVLKSQTFRADVIGVDIPDLVVIDGDLTKLFRSVMATTETPAYTGVVPTKQEVLKQFDEFVVPVTPQQKADRAQQRIEAEKRLSDPNVSDIEKAILTAGLNALQNEGLFDITAQDTGQPEAPLIPPTAVDTTTVIPEGVEAPATVFTPKDVSVAAKPLSELRGTGNIFVGQDAIDEVEKREGTLTAAQRRVVELEGFVNVPYQDKRGKAIGVGQTGKFLTKTFKESFKIHEDRVRKSIPSYDTLPEPLKAELVQAEYRGDIGISPKFRKLFNAGKFSEAATEFLNNDEFRSPDTLRGIKTRMQAVADVVRAHAEGTLPAAIAPAQAAVEPTPPPPSQAALPSTQPRAPLPTIVIDALTREFGGQGLDDLTQKIIDTPPREAAAVIARIITEVANVPVQPGPIERELARIEKGQPTPTLDEIVQAQINIFGGELAPGTPEPAGTGLPEGEARKVASPFKTKLKTVKEAPVPPELGGEEKEYRDFLRAENKARILKGKKRRLTSFEERILKFAVDNNLDIENLVPEG